MIRVTISYPKVADAAFDHGYYFNHHLPLMMERVGSAAIRLTVDRAISAPPWPDALHEVVCTFICASREAFEAAFFPHLEELQDDMDRCGGAAPLIHVSDIVFDQPCAGAMATPPRPCAVVRPLRRARASGRAAMASC
jgi:uncharacterized protein (TIGR02118 family)